MSWLPFIIKRFAGLLLLLIILSILVFSLSRALPGDPAAMYVGSKAKPGQIAEARRLLGLDQPLYIQYLRYMQRLMKGDLGVSFRTHRPVMQDLFEKLPLSLEVVLWALLLSLIVGVPSGVAAAYRQGTVIDSLVNWLSSASVSMPVFFLALLLQLVFFNWLGWFPLQGRISTILEFGDPLPVITRISLVDALIAGRIDYFTDIAWHMLLPTLSLAAIPLGWVARLTRSSLLEVMEQDYILAGRASGISERLLYFRYGLRNALSPVLSVLGLSLAMMLLATFYIEQIFNWPGIGYYSLQAIMSLDYPVLMGVTLVIGGIYVFSNTIVDIVRRLIDPRIK